MMQIMPSCLVLILETAFLGISIVTMGLPWSICLGIISAGRGQTYRSDGNFRHLPACSVDPLMVFPDLKSREK